VVSIKPFQPKPIPPPPPGEQIIHQQVTKVAPKPPVAQASDRVHFIMNTRMLIADAYNLPLGSEGRVTGGPDWITSQQYEVDARIDAATFAQMQKMPGLDQRRQVKLMEQALLADRFHLKVHFEKRPHDAYDLVIAKGGPKLTPTEEHRATSSITLAGDRMTVQSATITDWVHSIFLANYMLVDKTGLTGRYDFTLTYSEHLNADGTESAPPFRAAVQDQLGLKLEPTKIDVDYIAIDQVDRPTEN